MKSSFPNSSQFSPTQTPLPDLLLLVKANQPDRQKIKAAIAKKFFGGSPDPDIADNTIYALSEYRIVDKPRTNLRYCALTQLGEQLAKQAHEKNYPEMYSILAQHILLELHGLDLVQAADDLASGGTPLTKATISKELKSRGFHIPNNGTHLNGMRQWLEQSGLLAEGEWRANATILQKLLNDLSSTEIDEFASLTREQRAFANAFARMNVNEALSNRVAEYASTLYGVEFPEGGLPQSTLFALQDIGLITCEKTTSGQGAKPYIVRPTEKLRNDLLEQIFRSIEASTGSQYRKLIRKPLDEILAELASSSKYTKGRALEALAFYLGRLIDLDFVQWRLRSTQTGGAEIDVLMEGSNLIFSRWQIQCKNASQASLEDVAKELGLAQVVKANVIMIVTTGRVGKAARSFAQKVMSETNHQVVILDGKDLQSIKADASVITQLLSAQAKDAMKLKRSQIVAI